MQKATPKTNPAPYLVRVWFGTHQIVDHIGTEHEAQRYADGMRQRFLGLRVTCEQASSAEGSSPIPPQKLWSLTP